MSARIERGWLIALMIVALAHGVAYALLVPLWQSPDEPMLYEYVALTAQLGRIPSAADRSPLVESRIVDSLARNDFWRYTVGSTSRPPPLTMDEALARFWMPRQVGGDPPAYFAASALPLRMAAAWSVDHQVLLLRLLNAALLPVVVLCAYGAARELGSQPADGTSRVFPIAVAALVALQPMATAIGAAIGNDGMAILLALGTSSLLRSGWRHLWLGGWLVFWVAFAASALAHVVGHYAR